VTTGATMANFSALAAARHTLLERAGWDVEAEDFLALRRSRGGGRGGASVRPQGPGHARLGRKRIVRVPVDGQGRMRADALRGWIP